MKTEEPGNPTPPGWGKSGVVTPRMEPATGAKTIREEPGPDPEAMRTLLSTIAEDMWTFGLMGEAPEQLIWRGEGPRCDKSYPPGPMERSVRCELIESHWPDWPHSAQRSSV